MTRKFPWFRFYSEALNDKKITRACRLSGCPKMTVVGVWLSLLCLASESPERGRLLISQDMPITIEELLDETELDPQTLDNILQAFLQLNMISQHDKCFAIVNWHKRQRKSDSSADRVARHRQKKASNKTVTLPDSDGERGVTLQKRYSNVLDVDIDKEEDIDKSKNAHARDPAHFVPQPNQNQASTTTTTNNGHGFEYIHPAVNDMILAIKNAVKTGYGTKSHEDFLDAAHTAIGYDLLPEHIPKFATYWKTNGHYPGLPALKSFCGELGGFAQTMLRPHEVQADDDDDVLDFRKLNYTPPENWSEEIKYYDPANK